MKEIRELAKVMALCKAYELCKGECCDECGLPAPYDEYQCNSGNIGMRFACPTHAPGNFTQEASKRAQGRAKAVSRLLAIAKGEE